ncbi:recombinase family protein [Flavobacterium taihuense]|uniref:Recombinase family protein n=1 Tax=Flavobacterium taihuense TaxID=2857508 RepID=A0ABS6XT07_9FLAO|nr:recombinase family protein [Flavobacterium taihuense]MBW4359795.1 recombinase family protein [Flavobacterium taihuense]
MKIRYSRISMPSQKLERQLAKQNPDEVLFNDVVSGSVAFAERKKGKELIEQIEAGNVTFISVASVCRLGRGLHDIINTCEYFNSKGVVLRVDNLGLESMVLGKVNPTFNLIISVMANVAQMERETLLERQKEGIAIAKAKGVYHGRVKGSTETDAEVLSKYKEVVKFLKMGKSLRDIVGRCGVSLGTVQKVKQVMNKKAELVNC